MDNSYEQKIKGDNNDQSINKTENSNNINHETNTVVCMENTFNQFFQITENPNIDDLIKVCTLCLSERESLIIEKASLKAMEKVNFLADELRIVLKEQTIQSEKINELLGDPNFIYFLKNIQTSAIKTHDNDGIKTLAELISMRLKTNNLSMLELSIDESAEVISKLLPIHFKMLGIVYILKEVHLNSLNLDDLLNKYEKFIDLFSEIKNEHKQSVYLHLEYTKCARISSIKVNSNLIDFMYSEYYEHINNGISVFNIPEELKILMKKYNISFNFKNDNNQKVLIDIRQFNKIKNKITQEDISIFNKYINDNVSKDDFIKNIQDNHSKIFEFSKWWDESILSNMSLTNVGLAIAIAYLNSTTDSTFHYEIWI